MTHLYFFFVDISVNLWMRIFIREFFIWFQNFINGYIFNSTDTDTYPSKIVKILNFLFDYTLQLNFCYCFTSVCCESNLQTHSLLVIQIFDFFFSQSLLVIRNSFNCKMRAKYLKFLPKTRQTTDNFFFSFCQFYELNKIIRS